jgi:NADPH:quinone reductase
MKAMVIAAEAAGPRLVLADVPDPRPGPGELLVAVRAIGMNRADLLLRAGHFEKIPTRPPAPVAGLEAAGEVIAVGEGATGFRVGDRVMGMPAGAYAELTLLHHRLALRVPDGFSWEEAAALPVAMLTAHDGLVSNGCLRRGDAVLVQGASTGVGIVAIQVARHLGASVVLGTSGSPAKLERLRGIGLAVPIDRAGDVAAQVLQATRGHGADVILDMVGASAAAAIVACAAEAGRWVQVGRVGGAVAQIDLNELSRKRLRLIGVTFRTRSIDEFADVVRQAEQDLGAAIASRAIVSPVDRVLPLAEAAAAHALMGRNEHFGKLILRP